MKKVLMISVSALALSAGAALAETSASTQTLNQNGSANTAQIDQSATGLSNTSTVYQGVYGNGDQAASSFASVTQIGDVTAGTAVTSSTIQQNDTGNSATVTQTASNGGKQTSSITQGAAAAVAESVAAQTATGSNNTAIVEQTSSGSSYDQYSSITQNGQDGYVKVIQTGPKDISYVTQTGTGNNAGTDLPLSKVTSTGVVFGGVVVTQGDATLGNSSANTSYVYQYSDNSGISVAQNGVEGGTNSSTVTQSALGSGNFAGVIQTASVGLTNTSYLTQGGSNNIAGVKQH